MGGSRFFLYEYKGRLQNKPFEGMSILGFDLGERKLKSVWIDSFHMGTGMMFLEGVESKNHLSILGSNGGPGMDKPW